MDLQAEGPVPWRKEIGDAIETCAKMVCIIDHQYLLSFNCLEELAYAIHFQKPLAIAMLDQMAWDMLTMVGGAKIAWKTLPAEGASALHLHKGQPFGPMGTPFSLDQVRRIFGILASVNFCPCRDLDVSNHGEEGMTQRFCDYVKKDLAYTKEHADLAARASAWRSAGKPRRMLLQGADVKLWKEWISVAAAASAFPAPSDDMKTYVDASSRTASVRRKALQALGVLLAMVVACLLVVASVSYLRAEAQTRQAVHLRNVALEQQAIATVLLLSESTTPSSGVELHALLRAAEIAECISYPALVMPALTTAVSYLMQRPWVFDLKGHSDRVQRVAFDPRGLFLATGSYDGTVRLWAMVEPDDPTQLPLPSTAEPAVLHCVQQVRSLAWSSTGLLAAGCGSPALVSPQETAAVVVWEQRPGGCWAERHRLRGHAAVVNGLAWYSDASFLASSDDAGVLRVWRVGGVSAQAPVPYQQVVSKAPAGSDRPSATRALAFAPDRPLLAFGGLAQQVELWLVDGSEPPAALGISGVGHSGDINALGFSPDGMVLASASDYGEVGLWAPASAVLGGANGTSQLPLLAFFQAHSNDVTDLSWSVDGRLATSAQDQSVVVHRVDTDISAGTAQVALEASYNHVVAVLFSVDFHPSHTGVIVSGALSNEARGWRAAENLNIDGPERFYMNCSAHHPEFAVRGSDWSADGHTYAASSYQGHICIWQRPRLHDTNGHAIGRVGDWELTGALSVPGPRPMSIPSRAVAISPNADMVAAGDDFSGVTVWSRAARSPGDDTADEGAWSLILEWRAVGDFDQSSKLDFMRSLAWPSDSRYLAAGSSNGTVCVLPVFAPTAEPMHLEGHTAGVLALAWTAHGGPRGKLMLASGAADSTVRVWVLSYATEQQLRLLEARVSEHHTHDIASLAWSPSGLLASGSNDASVLVYEVPHADEGSPLVKRASLEGHTGGVYSLSWSADSTQLASSSRDSTVRIWELPDVPGEKAQVWTLPEQCVWSRWISLPTPRLACARRSPDGQGEPPADEAPYTYFLQFMLVDFQQQLRLLRRMTYGELDEDDLSRLGLLDIRDLALAPTHHGEICLPERILPPAGCTA